MFQNRSLLSERRLTCCSNDTEFSEDALRKTYRISRQFLYAVLFLLVISASGASTQSDQIHLEDRVPKEEDSSKHSGTDHSSVVANSLTPLSNSKSLFVRPEENDLSSQIDRAPVLAFEEIPEASSHFNSTEQVLARKEVKEVREAIKRPLAVEEADDSKVISALALGEFQQKKKEEKQKPIEVIHTDKNSTTVDGSTKSPRAPKSSNGPVIVKDNPLPSSTLAPLSNQRTQEPNITIKKEQREKECSEEETAGNFTLSTDQKQVTSRNCSSNKNESEMLVIEKTAIDLIPLPTMLGAILTVFAAVFMVIGGAIPYVFQYAEIYRRKSALGFSLLVCLALCLANILRIMFWFGKRFDVVLLVQSIVMISAMLIMLEISVRMNRKMTPPSQRTSVWRGDIINAFWKWNDLTSYIIALVVFAILAGIITYMFTPYSAYVEALGMISLLVEACLGLPQLVRNFQRKSTQGMSINMVLMWLVGDVGKTVYFIVREAPAQFWICSSLQITIDILILGQVYFYNRGTSRIPTYIPSQSTKTAA